MKTMGIGGMNIRYLLIVPLLVCHALQAAQAAARDAIEQIEALLRKPADTLGDADKRAVNRLLQGLSRVSDSSSRKQADRLSTLWEIKTLEHGCERAERGLIAILGEDNYARALKGEDIDPKKIHEGSRTILDSLLREERALEELLSELGVQQVADAQFAITRYKQLLSNNQQLKKIEELTMERDELGRNIGNLIHIIQETQAVVDALGDEQRVAVTACDHANIVRTEIYKKALGEKNFGALETAITQINEQKPAADLTQIIKLGGFPAESSLRKKYEEEIKFPNDELKKLKEELKQAEADLKKVKAEAEEQEKALQRAMDMIF